MCPARIVPRGTPGSHGPLTAIRLLLLLGCLGFSGVRVSAVGYVYNTSLSLTNPFSVTLDSVHLELLQSGFFHVHTIDRTKFTITNASFKLSGFMAGAAWGGDAQTQINGGVLTVASASFFSDSHSPSQIGQENSFGFSVRYDHEAVNTIFASEFLSGSGSDKGGYVDLPGKFQVQSYGSLTPIGSHTSYSAGVFALIEVFGLDVQIEGETIGNATAADLPPSETATPSTELQYSLGSFGLPMPRTENIPASVQEALGLKVKGATATGNDVRIVFQTSAGKTNYIQAGPDLSDASFADISGPIVVPGTNQMVTGEFIDTGGSTHGPALFYRIRFLR